MEVSARVLVPAGCLAAHATSSLCPLNASVPINGYALFGIGQKQVGDIPSIALDIPDFDGFVRMQIFANSSRTQIGCFQAVMTNGNSFGHPEALAPLLAGFTALSVVSSLATAAYGVSIPHMRTHYAHSFSVLLIFETFHTVFFSGALTVPWPSALVAWWSNFAWSAGLIYTSSMTRSVSPFAGIRGNASQVGGAGSTVLNNQGGLATQIYGRAAGRGPGEGLAKRKYYNDSDPFDYRWGGDPVTPGMPMPATYPGFRGTLSRASIPPADAFTVGLIWLLVAVGLLVLAFVVVRGVLEYLIRYTWIKEDRFSYFRAHYWRYTGLAVLRLLFVAFFMVTTLAIFQFTVEGSAGATAVAGVVFALFVVGMGGLVAYACHFRLRLGRYSVQPDSVVLRKTKLFKVVPFVWPTRSSTLQEKELEAPPVGALSFFRISFVDDSSRPGVHQDSDFVKRFGWLSARYRRTKWWFFAYYVVYQFFRACLLGGGARSPLGQVYGFFVYEIVAFVIIAKLKPFEGRRNTALGVWMLGLCKVITAGLTIALLPAFKLNRILATVIAIIIILAQGFVVIAVMILSVIGAISSWMSLTRNREEFEPEFLDGIRIKYFERMQAAAPDVKLTREEKLTRDTRQVSERRKKKRLSKVREKDVVAEPQATAGPYFSVTSVRREPKIEDEDGDVVADLETPHDGPVVAEAAHGTNRAGRTNSVNSRYSVGSLPRGARPHRTSWSERDFAQWDAAMAEAGPSGGSVPRDLRRSTSLYAQAGHSKNNSLGRLPNRSMSRTSLGSLRSLRSDAASPVLSPDRETLQRHAGERISSPPPVPQEPGGGT